MKNVLLVGFVMMLMATTVVQANSSDRGLIASRLFNLPLEEIDNNSSNGVNYDYNPWKNPWADKDGNCQGYDGGHSGVDIQTKDVAGSLTASRNFYAISSGEVIKAGGDTFNTIAIFDSSLNITTIYLHAETVNVSLNDTISVGNLLGVQGSTGAGNAEHVHFEVRSGRKTSSACGASTTLDPEYNALQYLVPAINYGETEDDSVSANDWRYYKLPGVSLSSDSRIIIDLFNLSDDLDLYVRKSNRPSTDEYDCRPYNGGNDAESCTIIDSGEWYIGVKGYMSGSFSVEAILQGNNTPTSRVEDLVFDDLETSYSQWFSPRQVSQTSGEYYRAYPNGSYLLEWNGNLWYNIEGSGWNNWGAITDWNL